MPAKKQLSKKEIVNFWRDRAVDDRKTAKALFV